MDACSHGFRSDLLSLKTASYAVMHLCVAIAVAYALTLDWRKALAIGILEPFVQTFAFTFHDRYWRKRERGKAHEVPHASSPIIS
ncbi:MAG: DUF2061 domain-containing protein [Sphingorhabdus sp.]